MTKAGLYNLSCFHAHQAVEKMLKAFLVRRGVNPPRIHKLLTLLNICAGEDGRLKDLKQDILVLDMYYIPTRYPNAPTGCLPDGLPNEKDAKNALMIAKKTRDRVFKGG